MVDQIHITLTEEKMIELALDLEKQQEFKPLFLVFKKPGIARKEMSLTKIAEELSKLEKIPYHAAYAVVKQFYRECDKRGIGRYVEGRRGRTSRFVSKFDFRLLVERLENKTAAQRLIKAKSVEIQANGHTEEALSARTETLLLRPGREVVVQLPADLTREEAERAATWIRILPYE